MTLSTLSKAAEARRTAEQEYRSAVLAAVDAHGVSKTARTLGVSRQAVAQLVQRVKRESADLDKRYAAIVDYYATSFTLSDAKAITAGRNAQARKRRKRGLSPLPTVKREAYDQAEREVLQRLEQGETIQGFTIIDLETLQTSAAKNEAPIPF